MNQLRTRILIQMLVLGLVPLTVFTVGIRFLPGGTLPWLWFAMVGAGTAVVAIAFSGRAAKPLKQGISAFRGLIHPDKGDLMRKWVPEEFWDVREDLKTMMKDMRSRISELEIALSRQQQTSKAAERAAVRSLEVLHGLADSSLDAVVFMHNDGHLALINEACMSLFGLAADDAAPGVAATDWLRTVATRFTGGSALAAEWEAWQNGSAALMEGEWIMAGPMPRVITVRTFGIRGDEGENLGRLWLFTDVTGERNVTRRLQDSQKMESMGQLAGGIAHDFNNLLTAIRGSLSLAQLEAEDSKQRQDHLDNAARAAARATELVGQILGYSRTKTSAPSSNVKQLLVELQNLLRASLDPKITLQCRVMDESWMAELPHVQLEQVLLNLCLNARDALGGAPGVIDLSTSHFTKTEDRPGEVGENALMGEYVVIHVRDTGGGIPEDVREHLFEPFFTTKAAGKGTGLGRATSHSIVNEAGGWMEFDTQVGKGTEFRVFLPRATEKQAPATEPLQATDQPAADTPEAKVTRGIAQGLILVVDDEAPVRSIAVNMLKYLGYQVMEAGDGEAALKMVAGLKQPLDAIMLDVHMPKLSGKDTFRQLRAHGNETPVIICSGFIVEAEEFKKSLGSSTGALAVLQKPYSIDSLARTVAETVKMAHQALTA